MNPESVVGLVGTVIFWIGFIMVLCMLRKYICFGVSIAAAEVLKSLSSEHQERMLSWFANADEIREELRLMREKNEH